MKSSQSDLISCPSFQRFNFSAVFLILSPGPEAGGDGQFFFLGEWGEWTKHEPS